MSERRVPVEPRIVQPQLRKLPMQAIVEYRGPRLTVRQIKTLGRASANGYQGQMVGEICRWFGTAKTQRVLRVHHPLVEFVESRQVRIFDRVCLLDRKNERIPAHSKPERVVKTQGGLAKHKPDSHTYDDQCKFDTARC